MFYWVFLSVFHSADLHQRCFRWSCCCVLLDTLKHSSQIQVGFDLWQELIHQGTLVCKKGEIQWFVSRDQWCEQSLDVEYGCLCTRLWSLSGTAFTLSFSWHHITTMYINQTSTYNKSPYHSKCTLQNTGTQWSSWMISESLNEGTVRACLITDEMHRCYYGKCGSCINNHKLKHPNV